MRIHIFTHCVADPTVPVGAYLACISLHRVKAFNLLFHYSVIEVLCSSFAASLRRSLLCLFPICCCVWKHYCRRLPAHRNIVTVYDVYEDRKCMYLVMELCDRVSLLDKLAEEGPLREDLARQIFVQILAAVKHCHDHHVVHRDLKPENVLFARRQQPADSGRQTWKPPTPPPLYRSCGTCQPTGGKAPPASCMGVASCCCCWMPHVDSSCEKPPFAHTLQCTLSSALCPTRHQTSKCCCTRREAEPTRCGSCSPAAVDLRSETATGRGGPDLTAPADQGSNNLCVNQVQPQNVPSRQQKGAEARGTTVADAYGRSEESQEITTNRTQQQGALQQEADPQQTCPHGERQLSGNFQRQRESALVQQRPSAERGNTREEVALWESQAVGPARPAENKAASLRNPELLAEGGATQENPPGLLAVGGRCCCCRCCGQEDAERDTRNNHLLSLHMWRRRDRQEPPTVKLIDFGAACSSARGQLRGTACGTTHYVRRTPTGGKMR
ncbi:UNVERIFIED_CONTAM: hypothetical protein H355_004202 [Colinus virginianus]|nr:hypothetical protein H355_004202 [Colinus virginianus]